MPPAPEDPLDLALALRKAEYGLRGAEDRVQRLLSRLFANWQGWVFTSPGGIDVYQANYSPGAVAILHRRGFVTVTIHNHRSARFLSCTCKAHERPRP